MRNAKSRAGFEKPLACDFIAYAFVPIATCYLFPTLTLHNARGVKRAETGLNGIPKGDPSIRDGRQ